MCHHEVEKFACGHEEKHKIPCEKLFETGSCSKPEDDVIRDNAGPACAQCKEDEEEMNFIQEEIQKLAERESLDPSAAPVRRAHDPNAPKLYFKRCIVWNRCGHHSHPRPSDIERDESDPEYLHVEGLGNCFDCSAAAPSTIAKMKENGDYKKEDPWGALSRLEVGEGSSRVMNLPSLEEIGQGVTHDQIKEQVEKRAAVSPPSSPDRASDRSVSPELGYDTGPTKGKAVPGKAVHPLAQVTTVEDDESGDEDGVYPPFTKPAKPLDFAKDLSEDEDEDEEKGTHHAPPRSKVRRGRSPSLGDSSDEDDAVHSGEESGEDDGHLSFDEDEIDEDRGEEEIVHGKVRAERATLVQAPRGNDG
ncbi:MAG: hypothetical protein Q9219_005182 [cf. Caloplaca sp. 3 TL-2023]